MKPLKFRGEGRADDAGFKPVREWVGGGARAPFFVHDRAEPYRPWLALWLELPDGFIIGRGIYDDEDDEGGIAGTLREAMASPAIGTPRRPDAIRVDDAATAAEVRAETDGKIPVHVAPTPELDEVFRELFRAMAESPGDVEPSYLEEGRLPAASVAALFEAGRTLFAHRPWALGDEPPLLQMDIPSLGVEGAVISIIGQAGEALGVLIFASVSDLDAFFDATEGEMDEDGHLGAEVLSLTFESATELPQSMRREATEHGWPVHGPDAYPVVQRREPDGVPNPLNLRDLRIATACAGALASFLDRHAEILDAEVLEPVSESHLDEHGREVRLSVPIEDFEDADLFDLGLDEFNAYEPLPADEPFAPRAGRNERCPCGSGKKYKKCHLPIEESEHAEGRRATAAHAMDAQLVAKLAECGQREFGEIWRSFHRDLSARSDSTLLVLPLAVFSFEADGTTLVETYLKEHGGRRTPEERRWLKAQQASWLSVWEVEAVEPGRSLTLRDLLSGERRTVLERKGSEVLKLRDAVLARVVDHDGLSLIAGFHASMLAPYAAADVVERARTTLELDGSVTADRLRKAATGSALLDYWEEAVREERLRSSLPPQLANTDGDPLAPTLDRFEVAAGAAREVCRLIRGIEGMIEDEDENGATVYVLLRPRDRSEHESTVLGSIRLDAEGLRIETNSEARADAAFDLVADACGQRIRHIEREYPELSVLGAATEGQQPAPTPPSPEEERLFAESKARHYAMWPDLPLPALGDKTPRECVRTPGGRKEVDLLLRHMENSEHRNAIGKPFNFSTVRDELGISSR